MPHNNTPSLSLGQQLIFAIVVTNAGGEGKSLFAQLFKAMLLLAGLPVEIIDGDVGNKSTRMADPTALSLGYGLSLDTAIRIVADTSGSNVVLDLGANAMASGQYHEFIFELQRLFSAEGYRCVAFLPVTPHKTGAVGAVKLLGSKLNGFEQVYVRNDKDGSGKFDGDFVGETTIDVGYMMPGIIEYMKRNGATIYSSIMAPPAGYVMASHVVANWAAGCFRSSEFLRGLLPRAGEKLQSFPARVSPLTYVVRSMSDATDSELQENARRSVILQQIDRGGFTSDALRSVAKKMDNGDI